MRIATPIKESLFDYTFGRNEYNVQQVLVGKDAKVHAFITLLFMEQGSIADNPEMGIDLVSHRHKLNSPSSVSSLGGLIRNQVETYLGKMITDVTVKVDPDNDSILDISASIEKEALVIKLDMNNPKIQVVYIDKNFNG